MGVNRINVNRTDSNYTHSIFDISEYTGRSYDALSDALADVPEGKQNGGMTIRYIIDNKYVQYRLMLDEWSINTDDWSFCENDVLIQSPEFMSVTTDEQGEIMESFGIKGEKHFYTDVHLENGLNLSQKAIDYLNSVLAFSYDASNIVDYYSKNLIKETDNLRRWSDLKLFFFSDVHASQTNVERIIEMANAFGGSKVDCIINGGDIVDGLYNEGLSWYNDLIDDSNIPILSVAGNHDCWKNTGWNWATGLEVYNLITAKVKESVPSIVQPSNAAVNGLNYYYKDFGNVRVICILSLYDALNNVNHYYDSAQNTWLANVLENARTTYHYWKIVNYMPVAYTLQSGDEVYMTLSNDAELNNKTQQDYLNEGLEGKIYAVPMSVIIVNHAPFNPIQARRIESDKLNSWFDYTKQCVNKGLAFDKLSLDETAVSTVADYIANGGSFICWLTGHKHVDSVLTHALHENQMMINISTANYNKHYDGVNAADISDPSYDSFDYLGVDLKSGMLKVVRMGWDEDSSMRTRRNWCYDYVNNKLFSEN